MEVGLAFFPRGVAPETERLRLLGEYLRATLSPLDEVQHEGLLQLQLEL